MRRGLARGVVLVSWIVMIVVQIPDSLELLSIKELSSGHSYVCSVEEGVALFLKGFIEFGQTA